jgi:hypothetical protein
LFLKHAALEDEWTPKYLADALGIDPATAKQIASELELVGYAEPVPEKQSLRNTPTGNVVAGAKLPARLTRETAEQILTDVADRAEAFNLDGAQPVRIGKIVAFGAINSKHERIQDIDLGVQIEPKIGHDVTAAACEEVIKVLRGRSPALKAHSLHGWPKRMGRVIWEK